MTFGELLKMNEAGAAPMGDEAAVGEMKNGGKADGDAVMETAETEARRRALAGSEKDGAGAAEGAIENGEAVGSGQADSGSDVPAAEGSVKKKAGRKKKAEG